MATLVVGVVVLALLLAAANVFTKADPRKLAPVLKMVGGMAALGLALVLATRGLFSFAVLLGVVGLGLLGLLPLPGLLQRTQKSPGQVSRVRSAFVEME